MTEPDRLAPGGRAVLSRSLGIGDVPGEGRTVRFEATPEECAALAVDLGILEVKGLKTEMLVKHWGKSGVEITGAVTAAVVQACVVTLEPVPQQVAEAIDIRFTTRDEAEAIAARLAAETADEEDSSDADVPDVFDGQTIPVGAVAEEFFALGLDPYPRKEGIAFDAAQLGFEIGEPISDNPFAVLGKMKPKP
jgi:uncharacterized metal-binding protein YceD (DUF177 family)